MSGNKALSLSQQDSQMPETDWTVVAGPLSGTKVRMTQTQFSIGRSHECELPIPNDPKVSRKQALVYWDGQAFRIQSLVSQNPVLIEGQPISDSEIHSGTIIQLGDSQIKFVLRSQGHLTSVPAMTPPAGIPPSPPQPPRSSSFHSSHSRPTKKSGANAKRWIIYGVIGALVWWLLSDDSGKKKNPFEIRMEKQIESDIEEARELQKIAEKARGDRLSPTVSERNAQEHYVKGFRDFRKGQYERSIGSFQACLALAPDHPLCNRYLKLSQKKFGELIQYHMVLGRKYRDQNQFKACRAAFRNVMVMVRDPSSSIYKEAKTNYVACNSLVEGRF